MEFIWKYANSLYDNRDVLLSTAETIGGLVETAVNHATNQDS